MSTTMDQNSNNSNSTNTTKMTSSQTRSIKIHFEGCSRAVHLPASTTLAGLQAAVASTFSVDLPARSGAEGGSTKSDLSFTYKDPDGDNIVFDKDSELHLALRLCPESLEIIAACEDDHKDTKPSDKADPEGKLNKIAARNLREYHGVPSMTPAKLTKTLALLKLGPRRLVKQGLAPKVLLARMKAIDDDKAKQQPLGGGDQEDLADSVAAGMKVMGLEEKKKQNDLFVVADQPASGCDGAVSSPADDEGGDATAAAAAADAATAVKKSILHKAFVDGGVQLRPREVRPLLLALAVKPCRLARLGLVDAKDLRAMLHAERKDGKRNGGCGRGGDGKGIGNLGPRPHHPHHRHQRMARGGPGGPPHCPSAPFRGFAHPTHGPMVHGGGGRGGPGGPAAGGKMMRRHHAHPPPPPLPRMEENDEGMFDAPARAGVPSTGHLAGRRAGRRSMHPHPHPIEQGEGGADFHHGTPLGVRMVGRMGRARNGGGGGGGGVQQVPQGYYYWG